jgi:excinuclease ABC subunit A
LGLEESGLQRKCSACKGRGQQRFDMGFLPAVRTECEICRGSGYLPEAWQIHWRGICLPELVSLTIEEAYELLRDEESLARPLAKAMEAGLGYLVLRQPGSALSGGEAQRLKIAKELARKTRSQTLFILDEPTVGLHLSDVQLLLEVFDHLVDADHSVVVIEHHASLLAACDWLIELGPGGGPEGGWLIGTGRPGELAAGDTPTAPYLRSVLPGLVIGERL